MPRRNRSSASSLRSSSPRTTSCFVGVFPPLRGWLSRHRSLLLQSTRTRGLCNHASRQGCAGVGAEALRLLRRLPRYAKVSTDLACKNLADLGVARNRRSATQGRVGPPQVAPALTDLLATMFP
jgi:hypothetical protein